jgi:dipeptide/tripeptide permease
MRRMFLIGLHLPLIGGWLADKIFGARRASVLIGGIIIMPAATTPWP